MRKRKYNILLVVGARPNFMKIAPIMRAMSKSKLLRPLLLHTGQHYDEKMSDSFFRDLKIPKPDICLGVGLGSHAQQTARIMMAFEKALQKIRPDVVVVAGDVNSTLACSVVSAKMGIPVAHVEAGLRSFDRSMPEEINRVVTDHVSDFLFTTCQDGNKNLIQEGINKDKIFFVGNTMIDTLKYMLPKIRQNQFAQKFKAPYALLTLHRPSNVDKKQDLLKILDAIKNIQTKINVLFPVHPRTQKSMGRLGLGRYLKTMQGLTVLAPLSYLDFMSLMINAKMLLTDSGGIQEETTFFGIPCLTLRENTERPITITQGSNILVKTDTQQIVKTACSILQVKKRRGRIPKFWDGYAAERIFKIFEQKLT